MFLNGKLIIILIDLMLIRKLPEINQPEKLIRTGKKGFQYFQLIRCWFASFEIWTETNATIVYCDTVQFIQVRSFP